MEPGELIAFGGAIGTAITVVVGGIIALVLKWKRGKQTLSTAETKAATKARYDEHAHIRSEWERLHTKLEARVDKLSNDHLECEKNLAAMGSKVHDLQEECKWLRARFENPEAGSAD